MAAVGRRDSFLNNITPLCVFLLIIMMSASSSKADTNVLLTGQTLSRHAKLSYANSQVSLIMDYDCNVVLFDDNGVARWKSNTGWLFFGNCSLSLTNKGRLVITYRGKEKWISPNANSKVGKYVAVLRPEGQLSIYGPGVWSVGVGAALESNISNEMVSSMTSLRNTPMVYNVLFSGQVLYNNGKLSDNGYSFIMKEDCELVLEKSNGEISWQTWTIGNGRNCFARLDYRGGLAVLDDAYAPVWNNSAEYDAPTGKYVLVMQSNGNAVIYGPEVWSTEHSKNGLIEMPTVQV